MTDFLDLLNAPSRHDPAPPGPVLFVFPHPDDDIFVGGTLSLLVRAGVRVHAAWMTSGGYDGLDQVRENEMQRAMDIAGVARRHLLRLLDGKLIGALEDACATLHLLIGEIEPRAVIGPAFRGRPRRPRRHELRGAASCRRAGRSVPIFEYPCYAPDADVPNGLRLAAFPLAPKTCGTSSWMKTRCGARNRWRGLCDPETGV